MLASDTARRALVFGASGQIGSACAARLDAACAVTRSSRSGDAGCVNYDPKTDERHPFEADFYDAVVWAQGANLNDSVLAFDAARHLEIYEANTLFVLRSMAALLATGTIRDGARLVIVSSIWQNVSRSEKLSYMASKAAAGAIARSAAIDLAPKGILVNAVLPGALDTPMTRANLSTAQIGAIADATPHGRLATTEDVARLVAFLCSAENSATTGQSLAVDLGFSDAKII